MRAKPGGRGGGETGSSARARARALLSLTHASRSPRADFGEFLALELLRLGKIDRATLSRVKLEFVKRDTDGSGEITWDEIVAHHKKQAVVRKSRAIQEKELVRTRGVSKAQAKRLSAQITDEEVVARASARHLSTPAQV